MYDRTYLEHVGIPGMRWGHRKSRTPTVIRTTNSEDYMKKLNLKSKKLSEMTNAELKTYNERVLLEKQYKNLSKNEISPGRKFVQDIIATQGKNMINQYLSAHSKKLVDDLLKKTMKD